MFMPKHKDVSKMRLRTEQCAENLNVAYQRVEDKVISYASLKTLLSAAYSYATEVKTKRHISTVRKLAADLTKKQSNYNRARQRATDKGLTGGPRLDYCKKYKFKKQRSDLRSGISIAMGMNREDRRKWNGHMFEHIADVNTNEGLINVESTQPIVIQEASLVVATTKAIAQGASMEAHAHKFERLESNFYIVQTRVAGFKPSVIPSKVSAESLGKVMGQHGVISELPFAFQMSYPGTNRIWYPIFDFPINPQTVAFSDHQSMTTGNSKVTVTLSKEDITYEEIYDLLISLNFPYYDLDSMAIAIKGMSVSDRLSKVNLQLERLRVTNNRERLQDIRFKFMATHHDLYSAIKRAQDDIASFTELSKEASAEFQTLTADHNNSALLIVSYDKLFDSHFREIELEINRTEPDSRLRQSKLESMKRDRLSARICFWIYKEARKQCSEARAIIKQAKADIEFHRRVANNDLDSLWDETHDSDDEANGDNIQVAA